MDIFENIRISEEKSYTYNLDSIVYEGFLNTFKDQNDLHIHDQYAQDNGFKSKVMHGNILNGFLSHFIGMVYPGNNVIIHSQSIEYKKPNFLNDEIELHCTTDQVIESVRAAVLKIKFKNITQGYLSAKGKIQVGFLK